MKKKLYLGFIVLLILSIHVMGDNSPYVRYPAINGNGKMIAFSFQGDIWTIPVTGGRAFRVTIHEAYDGMPVFSPTGKSIVFSSNRLGNNDIFSIGVNGGNTKRLTFNSSDDIVTDWSKKYGIVFESRRNYRQIEWEKEILSIPLTGGTPELLLKTLGTEASVSPNGRLIAFVKGSCRVAREKYTGSANRNIWIFNSKTGEYIQITKYEGQDFHPSWDNENLYFISARNGRYNIFKIKIDKDGTPAGKVTELTKFSDEPVTWMSVSKNGDLIAFEKGTDIFTISKDGKTISKLNVNIDPDYRFDPLERKTFSSKVSDYEISPNGKLLAFIVHGEVFVTQSNDKKARSVNLSNHPFRDKDVAWLNDGSVIFSSDRAGEFDLYLVKSTDQKEKNIFKSLKHKVIKITDSKEEETYPVISPDGKKIAFLRGNGKLVVADIDKNGNISGEKLLLNGWAEPSGITFSPDGKWVAYALDDLNFNSEIYIQPIDNSRKPTNVSMHPRGDYSPVWSPDGSKLGFLSMRNNSTLDVWFAWLKKSDWEKTAEDWEDGPDSSLISNLYTDKSSNRGSDKKRKGDSKKKKLIKVKIDLKGIYRRLVQVTSLPGDETALSISKDGNTFLFSADSPGAKGKVLYSIKWDGKKLTKFSGPGNNPRMFVSDSSGKFLYFISGRGTIAKADVKSKKIKSLPFRAWMKIEYKKELDQIFEEAWRMLRDNFYDPQFHGKNWAKLKKIYKPMCMKASVVQDFRDMYNLMLGRLNASHMGMYGSGREVTQKITTGLLGIRINPVSEGVKVAGVIDGSPAGKSESRLYTGDTIISVGGESVTNNINFWSLLADTGGEKVLLGVKNEKGKFREVIIRPVTSLRSLLYDEWVEQRRKLTEKFSGGKLGYLHIQGMNMSSFERFERELASAGYGKKGIVIDVRYNGGGWTTDYLMAILNVKQHSYTIPRGAVKNLGEHKKFRDFYPFAERLPFYAWNKPSIALCNASSYSNAEIFSHAYKTLGIGTLVGEPTFGAVISTGGLRLINGMYVRKPFRAWYVKATDKNMEWGPAVPNVILKNSPDEKEKGTDSQLKKACELLLDQLKNK